MSKEMVEQKRWLSTRRTEIYVLVFPLFYNLLAKIEKFNQYEILCFCKHILIFQIANVFQKQKSDSLQRSPMRNKK